MRVLAKPKLKAFWEKHPDARLPLEAWYKTTLAASWANLSDVRKTYPHADAVELFCGLVVTVFNIGGNKYRLITGIVYRTHYVYVKEILTHPEYSLENWKVRLCRK